MNGISGISWLVARLPPCPPTSIPAMRCYSIRGGSPPNGRGRRRKP